VRVIDDRRRCQGSGRAECGFSDTVGSTTGSQEFCASVWEGGEGWTDGEGGGDVM
jgi:hypothetical protein